MLRRRDERSERQVGRGTEVRAVVALLAGVAVLAASLVAAAVTPASASGASTKVKPAPTLAQACGTKPVTMNAYVETGFPDPIKLMNLFHKQHPRVSWKIRQDAFAVITQNAPLVLNGPNPPDIMRLPQVSGLVKDHLLKNLDGYFKQYHWNKFPASQLAQVRMPAAGRHAAPGRSGPTA
jgi:raffinose/stachyose/melibiose transport system substrate-binding protein